MLSQSHSVLFFTVDLDDIVIRFFSWAGSAICLRVLVQDLQHLIVVANSSNSQRSLHGEDDQQEQLSVCNTAISEPL